MYDFNSSGPEDVNTAVNNARNAFNLWSKKVARERGQILTTAAFKIRVSCYIFQTLYCIFYIICFKFLLA